MALPLSSPRPFRAAALGILVVMASLASVIPGVAMADGPGDEATRGPGGAGVYLVVAPADWEDDIAPLMDWRARTGELEPVFLAFEDAVSEGTGRDAPARLKDSISRAGSSGGGLCALLLVGDSDVLPVRRVFVNITGDGNVSDPLNYRWTDDYFVYGHEAAWDRDGDGVHGEDGEVLEEVAEAFADTPLRRVGRIPASTTLELERFVDKLLAYEREPPPGDWYRSALLASGLMDVPNHIDYPFIPNVDGGYQRWSDNSYESHRLVGGMLPEGFDVTWLYDYPHFYGGSWNLSVDTLDHGSVVAAFDTGHSIVAMNGHGWEDGSGLAHYNGSGSTNYWWDWNNAFDYLDADEAQNGGRLPWVYVAACYVGDVTLAEDRTLERLVMNPHGGAVGLVAGNGENYKAESLTNASFGNWFLEQSFWRHYLEEGPGTAMHLTKGAFLELVSSDVVPHTPLFDAYYMADYLSPNLLGDPMTRVWTDVPRTLLVDGLSDVYGAGDDGVEVAVIDDGGGPVDGATVSVRWSGGDAMGITNAYGRADVPVPLDAGELDVLVSARNHLPVEVLADRPVTELDLVLESLEWTGEGLSPGEPPLLCQTVELRAAVRVNGRYGYDQARVRFLVSRDGEVFERLLPDLHVPVSTGGGPVAVREWSPPQAGQWVVRAVVDPEGVLPDAEPGNNRLDRSLPVRGPPEWMGTPDSIVQFASNVYYFAPKLGNLVLDPDTPTEELSFSVEVVSVTGGSEDDVVVFIDERGMLGICSRVPHAHLRLRLSVSDGTFVSEVEMDYDYNMDPPARLALLAPGPYHISVGEVARGTIDALGPSGFAGYRLVVLSDSPAFELSQDGTFNFTTDRPGTHVVEVGIEAATLDGALDWQGTVVVFNVAPAGGLPPRAVGWTHVRLASGSAARVHLLAEDPEGSEVQYSVLDDGGLPLSIDPWTGILTIHAADGDVGLHEVTVRLTDGVNDADAVLTVHVSEGEEGFDWVRAMVIVLGLAFLVALLVQARREGRAGR